MKNFKVIVTDDRFGSYKEEQAVLKEIGAELKIFNCKSDAELIAAARDADGIMVNLYPMSCQVINQLTGCRVISRYGVGYDNVNVEAATQAGIWVAIVPDYGVEEVSDHSLAMLLSLLRKLPFVHGEVKKGEWNIQNRIEIPRTTGKVMGLIGYGRIGRSMHRKIAGFGFSRVLITDPYIADSEISASGGVPVPIEKLLAESDFISIHVCLNPETRHLLGKNEFALMKNNAFVINTSRGAIIDETALCTALQEKRIAGAGLDVFETEPVGKNSKLLELDNVLLTSHMAYYSAESIVELKTKAARNVAEVLVNGRPLYAVNQVGNI